MTNATPIKKAEANKSDKQPRDKAAKFKELAPKRVTKTLNAIAGIAKLSGSNYTYTVEQVSQIVKAVRDSVSRMESQFSGQKQASKGFDFE